MGRETDLALALAAAQKTNIGLLDLTPDGALSAVGNGPVVTNTIGEGCVQAIMAAGSGTMDVRLEGSNTQEAWVELYAFTGLTGVGTSEFYDNWKRCTFLRLRVVNVGTGGTVTATQALPMPKRR